MYMSYDYFVKFHDFFENFRAKVLYNEVQW